jgi:alpha-ketoglutarate-dependent taurine dioxygenase
VINNRRIFHGRTALSDNSNRFLKRYWISKSKHKKLE